MKLMFRILALCVAISSPALAQTPSDLAAIQNEIASPYPLNRYHDGEEQAVLDWQRLVRKANEYRYRQAAKEAAERAARNSMAIQRQTQERQN